MPPEAILGKTRREVYEAMYTPAEPKLGGNWESTFAAFARREPFRDIQILYIRPDGSRWYFRSNGKPVFDADGTFLGYRGASSDISERKGIEQALTESEGRFRNFAEALPQLVFEADRYGRFTFINRSGLETTGYTQEDLNKGLCVYDLLAPGDRDRVRKLFDENLAATETGPVECTAQRKDGSAFPALVQSTPAFLDSNPVGFRGMMFDITKRKQTEATAQRQAEELAHVQRVNAMGQLSSAIAHELNQPLTATMLYLQAGRRLLQTDEAASAAKVPELLDKSATQIERAGAIIRRLRDFVEKGKSAPEVADINELIEETCAIALIGARVDGVTVTFDLDDHLPPAFIDRLQIEQVLFNLVRNAIEAINGGENRELTIRSSFDGKQVYVAVSDAGQGLSDKVRARLFEPFVTTKEEGMGVGLSISRSIVEAHEGRIWAEENAAGGTTFVFSLPAANQGENEGDGRANRTYR
jgi:two-component system sensor kinase FixL